MRYRLLHWNRSYVDSRCRFYARTQYVTWSLRYQSVSVSYFISLSAASVNKQQMTSCYSIMVATGRIAAVLILQLYSPVGAHMHAHGSFGHLSLPSKQHLDRFSRFCRAYSRDRHYRHDTTHTQRDHAAYICSYTLKNIPISTDILWRVFHIFKEPGNQGNNEARCHIAMYLVLITKNVERRRRRYIFCVNKT